MFYLIIMKNRKYHWNSSNEQLVKYTSYEPQQQLVDVLAMQLFPFYSPIEPGIILGPLHIYLSLVLGKKLSPFVFWNHFCLTTETRQFAVLFNWLFHPQVGFHVEIMFYSTFEKNPAPYKQLFLDNIYLAYPLDNVNRDVTKNSFTRIKALYDKPILARLFRLHLNLFNPLFVKQANELGILNPLLRSLVQLSREKGTYNYVILCMEEMSFHVNENGNYSLKFNGMPFPENEKLEQWSFVPVFRESADYFLIGSWVTGPWEKERGKEDNMLTVSLLIFGLVIANIFIPKRNSLSQDRLWLGEVPPVAMMNFVPSNKVSSPSRGLQVPLPGLGKSRAARALDSAYQKAVQQFTTPNGFGQVRYYRKQNLIVPKAIDYSKETGACYFNPFRNIDEFFKDSFVIWYEFGELESNTRVSYWNENGDFVSQDFYFDRESDRSSCSVAVEFVNTQTTTTDGWINLQRPVIMADKTGKEPTQVWISCPYQQQDTREKTKEFVTRAVFEHGERLRAVGFHFNQVLEPSPHDKGHPSPETTTEAYGLDHLNSMTGIVPKKFNGNALTGWDNKTGWSDWEYTRQSFHNLSEFYMDRINKIKTRMLVTVEHSGLTEAQKARDTHFLEVMLPRQAALARVSQMDVFSRVMFEFTMFQIPETAWLNAYIQDLQMTLFQTNLIKYRLELSQKDLADKKKNMFVARNHYHAGAGKLVLKTPETQVKIVEDALDNWEVMEKMVETQARTMYELISYAAHLHSAWAGHSPAEHAKLAREISKNMSSSTSAFKQTYQSGTFDQAFYKLISKLFFSVNQQLHGVLSIQDEFLTQAEQILSRDNSERAQEAKNTIARFKQGRDALAGSLGYGVKGGLGSVFDLNEGKDFGPPAAIAERKEAMLCAVQGRELPISLDTLTLAVGDAADHAFSEKNFNNLLLHCNCLNSDLYTKKMAPGTFQQQHKKFLKEFEESNKLPTMRHGVEGGAASLMAVGSGSPMKLLPGSGPGPSRNVTSGSTMAYPNYATPNYRGEHFQKQFEDLQLSGGQALLDASSGKSALVPAPNTGGNPKVAGAGPSWSGGLPGRGNPSGNP